MKLTITARELQFTEAIAMKCFPAYIKQEIGDFAIQDIINQIKVIKAANEELDKMVNGGSKKDSVIEAITDLKSSSLQEMNPYILSVQKSMNTDNDMSYAKQTGPVSEEVFS